MSFFCNLDECSKPLPRVHCSSVGTSAPLHTLASGSSASATLKHHILACFHLDSTREFCHRESTTPVGPHYATHRLYLVWTPDTNHPRKQTTSHSVSFHIQSCGLTWTEKEGALTHRHALHPLPNRLCAPSSSSSQHADGEEQNTRTTGTLRQVLQHGFTGHGGQCTPQPARVERAHWNGAVAALMAGPQLL